MRNEVLLKVFWYGTDYVKMHDFHGNHFIIFEDWGRPTNSIISRVPLILEHYNWFQIKEYTYAFFPVVRYVNLLICIL